MPGACTSARRCLPRCSARAWGRDRAEVRAEVAEIRAVIKPMADFMQQKSGAAWAAKTSAAVFLFLVALVGAIGGALSFLKVHFASGPRP